MKLETIPVEDNLYEVLRTFNKSYFTTKKKEINKNLVGIWVEHLEGNKVIQTEEKFHVCRLIEEAKMDNINV